jgi:TRAP-type uncharacterized transport system fused permease subunit
MASDVTPTPPLKPGWQSTEFWLALVPPVLAILTTFGLLTQSQAQEWAGVVQNVIVAVAGLLATAWAATHYAAVRTQAKVAVIRAADPGIVRGVISTSGPTYTTWGGPAPTPKRPPETPPSAN